MIKLSTALWLVAYYIWPHLGPSSCLVCVYVLDFKLILRRLTWLPLKESLDTLSTHQVSLWYPKEARFHLVGYSDLDYAGCKIDRKSTSEGCHLLGRSLVAWTSKKQNSMALSTAEAEYICRGCLLCTNSLHEANSSKLWRSSRKGTSLVWQWECGKAC